MDSAEAAQREAERIGYPVALKVADPEVVHKSDVGGVRLDLADAPALHQAYEAMVEVLPQARSAPLLHGYRGAEPCDVAALEQWILRVGWLAEDLPEVAELDLNPVMASPKARWSPTPSSASSRHHAGCPHCCANSRTAAVSRVDSRASMPWEVRKLESRSAMEPSAERTTIRAKGQVTIPRAIRDAARLSEGDLVEVVLTDEGILLRPKKVVDATQAWFWTPEWQAGEREASEDIAAGQVEVFEDDESFLASLDA